jgi:hypothetical protein
MKATSGSGRPTADPCLRAAGSFQRPFSVVRVASAPFADPTSGVSGPHDFSMGKLFVEHWWKLLLKCLHST